MSQALTLPAGDLPSAPPPDSLLREGGARILNADTILYGLSFSAALAVMGMLLALVIALLVGSWQSIVHFGPSFLTTADWRTQREAVRDPVTHRSQRDASGQIVWLPGETFGALAVMYGTAMTSLIALVLAVPPSFAAAIFLIRIAPRWLAGPVSFLVEFLAAIPSLAYGLWGMFVLTRLMANHIEPALIWFCLHVPGLSWLATYEDGSTVVPSGYDLLTGGLILAIMILPIITAVSRDVLRAVPRAQVEGTVALGATWWQSSKEMLKYSRSGLFGAVTLGLARAAGETMAIAMVIGIDTRIHHSPFEAAQTMSSLLAVSFGEVTGLERSSMIEVALILLIMSLLFNIVARWLVVGKDSRGARAA